MTARIRRTLYFTGNPSIPARVHLIMEGGIEFDIVSDAPHYPHVSWKIDLDTAPEDIRLRVLSVADDPERLAAWVVTSISEGGNFVVEVKGSHDRGSHARWVSPHVVDMVVVDTD